MRTEQLSKHTGKFKKFFHIRLKFEEIRLVLYTFSLCEVQFWGVI